MSVDSGAQILARLEQFAAFGPRWMGSEGAARVRDRITLDFAAAGLAVEQQEFEYLGFADADARIRVGGDRLACEALVYSSATAHPLSAPLVYVGQGTKEDFRRIAAEGGRIQESIVVSDNLRSFVAYPEAEAAGAKGFILSSNLPGNVIRCGTVRLDRKLGTIPALSIGGDDAARMVSQLRAGRPLTATIEVQCRIRPATGYNVIGRRTNGEMSRRLLVSAHYDSFWNGIHAMDNLAGACTLLELARTLPGEVTGNLEFIAFAGEELGCWGAAGYVARSDFEPGSVRALINLDAFGSNDSLLEIGVTEDLRKCCEEQVARLGISVDRWSVPPRAASDQQEFLPHGVSSVWLANAGADKHYHTPFDTVARMNTEKLSRVFSLATGLARSIAAADGIKPGE